MASPLRGFGNPQYYSFHIEATTDITDITDIGIDFTPGENLDPLSLTECFGQESTEVSEELTCIEEKEAAQDNPVPFHPQLFYGPLPEILPYLPNEKEKLPKEGAASSQPSSETTNSEPSSRRKARTKKAQEQQNPEQKSGKVNKRIKKATQKEKRRLANIESARISRERRKEYTEGLSKKVEELQKKQEILKESLLALEGENAALKYTYNLFAPIFQALREQGHPSLDQNKGAE